MYKRILIPVDGSATSKKALTAALQLAREGGGRLRLLHSVDELAYLSGFEYSGDVIRVARDNAAKVLDDASAMSRPPASRSTRFWWISRDSDWARRSAKRRAAGTPT